MLWENLQIFGTIFLSVLIGALPFLIIAVLAAGFIEVFLTRQIVHRFLPRNPVWGVLLAPLIGFILPLCECGIIPVAGKLTRKGVPLGVAVAFMLANPIINPFPLLSTRLAFPYFSPMVLWRLGGAYLIAVIIGGFTLLLTRLFPTIAANRQYFGKSPLLTSLGGNLPLRSTVLGSSRLVDMLTHASLEFFNVGRFFIIGAFFAALINVFVSHEIIESLGSGNLLSVLTMSVFAFLISVCSEADAFVAASFSGRIPVGALLAFLVLGPMLDIKNTLMMLATFKKPFVIWLMVTITILVMALGMTVNLIYTGGLP